jgi:hypothetical protein
MNASPDSIYGFSVRQMPIGGAIHSFLIDPISGVLHTTEGSLDDAVHIFHKNGDPPHFAVDASSIIQFRPLDERAMSLRHDPNNNIFKGQTNGHAVQIEIAARSQASLWLPDDNSVGRIAAVMAYASKMHDIPLIAPNNFPDDCSDLPTPAPDQWAMRNTRRVWAEANWPDARGWWMHMEVPGQGITWHWDCGAMQRSVLIQKAQEFLDGSVPP